MLFLVQRPDDLSLSELVELGRKVDPLIVRALRRSSSPSFRSTATYHFEVGGKRVRAAMAMLSCLACGGSMAEALAPGAVVEMIHNYSLVMDDIIDRAVTRRGKPTVRVHAGESVALLVAMQYREVMEDLIDECRSSSRIRRIAVDTMKEIIEGERLDLLFEQAGRSDPYLRAHRVKQPSIPLYLRMIGKKTAALFRAASEVGAYGAGASPSTVASLGGYGWKAGVAFQMADDILDIFGTKTGKESAKDIIEHKLGNISVLMAMKFLPVSGRLELQRILRKEVVSRTTAQRARHLISQTPAERASREVANGYMERAIEQLKVVGKSHHAIALKVLAKEFVDRTY